MLYLKQSTASQSVLIGPFVDSTDGTTAETGLTIANTDIRLSKNGGNLAAKNSGGATHDEAGWYTITLDATDTNTVGRLQLHCKMSGALMVFAEFQVLEETVYDALFASSAAGEFAVKLSTQGKADVNAEADTALSDYDPPTKAELDSGLAALNDPTAAAIADAVLDEALSGHTTAGTLGKAVADIETDAAAILVDTAEIGTAGAGLTAVPWNAAWDAEVQSECADALNAYDPPTNAEMEARTLAAANYATAANLATVDTVVDNLNLGIIYGSAQTGTLSTTQASTDLTGYADDQLIGRVIIWTSGNCEGEATDITDYANTSGVLTFTALTTAPGNGDTFKIV